jgi:hypothetical protein
MTSSKRRVRVTGMLVALALALVLALCRPLSSDCSPHTAVAGRSRRAERVRGIQERRRTRTAMDL